MNQVMKVIQWTAIGVISVVIILYVLFGIQMLKPISIFDAMRSDHQAIRGLIARTWGSESAFREAKARLIAHQKGEEDAFYNVLEAGTKLRWDALVSVEEHHVIEFLLGELAGAAKNDERWNARFEVLAEYVEHHFREEENKIFPEAAGIFDKEQADRMGRQYEKQRHLLLWKELHSL